MVPTPTLAPIPAPTLVSLRFHQTFNLAEAPDDPAGDDHPEVSCVEKMMKDLEDLL